MILPDRHTHISMQPRGTTDIIGLPHALGFVWRCSIQLSDWPSLNPTSEIAFLVTSDQIIDMTLLRWMYDPIVI